MDGNFGHTPSHRDDEDYTPSPIMRYFSWTHLQPEYAAVSEPICRLAMQLDRQLPPGPEKSVALRKLLEAKDAAVRTLV